MIVEQVREMAKEEQIPVLGVGPASEMARERPGHRPEDLLAGAQSLICFGLPVPQAVYRTPAHTLETVWRSQNLNYRRLDTSSLRIAARLEESGWSTASRYGKKPSNALAVLPV